MREESPTDDLDETSLGELVKYNLKGNCCKLLKNMLQFFKDEQFCDITLMASDGVKIKAHRLVLSSASDYFRAMFCGSLKEAKEGEATFPEIDGRTLKTIITSIYSNSIILNSENIEYIISSAHLLQITSIEDACCEFLTSELDVTTAIGIIQMADKYNYTNLYNTSHKFILERFMEIRLSEEFFHLEVDFLDKILADDNLRVPSEEEVFNDVSSWIIFAEDREIHVDRLLQRVRMPLVRPSFICDVMENVCTSEKCKELFYKWLSIPKIRSSLLPTEQFRLRSSKDVIIAIDGWQQTKTVLRVGLLYPPLNEWIYKEWPCPLGMRTGFASTIFDNKLIIAGGISPSDVVSNQVDCFDLRTLEWTELPRMLSARHSFEIAVLNGELYAVCGFNRKSLNSVEIYNTITETWSYTTAMNINISNPVVGVKGSSLCVSHRKSNWEGSLSLYDHSSLKWTDEWLYTRSLPLGMGTVSVNGKEKFVAICKDEIIHFDLSTGLTERVPIYVIDSEAKGCKVFQNRFIIHGQSVFQEYNPIERSFRTFPSFEGTEGDIIVV